MRILGIDPGPTSAGVVLYDTESRRVLDCADIPCADVLEMRLSDWELEAWARNRFDRAIVEAIEPRGQHGTSQPTIDTHAVQVLLQYRMGAKPIGRSAVKLRLLGQVAGNDARVNGAIRAIFARWHACDEKATLGTAKAPGPLRGASGRVTGHMWAALAAVIAATYTEAELTDMTGAA